jgi:hypothetical protein
MVSRVADAHANDRATSNVVLAVATTDIGHELTKVLFYRKHLLSPA